MRRIIATVVAAVGLLLGSLTVAPTPVDAHATPSSYEICVYIRNYHAPYYALMAHRTIHYGADHVTQCWVRYSGTFSRCFQHIWGIGTYEYDPSFGGVPNNPCW